MHQYELMRLIERLARALVDVAPSPDTVALHLDITRLAAEWKAEEEQYTEAVLGTNAAGD